MAQKLCAGQKATLNQDKFVKRYLYNFRPNFQFWVEKTLKINKFEKNKFICDRYCAKK